MLRLAAIAASVLALSGCLGSGPFESCKQDSWPSWDAGDHDVRVCVDGDARSATLYVPESLPQQAPLLLLLHGGGGNAAQVRSSSGMDAVADDFGFAVLYADGTPSRVGNLRTWNALICCGRAFDEQSDDVAFLGHLLDGALQRFPLDTARIGVAGHSNGAMMAYRLAAERSDVVAAVMPVAGAIGGHVDEDAPVLTIPTPEEPVSVLILHARDDDHVPYDGGHGTASVDGPRIDLSVEQAIQFWLDADGCPRVGATVSSSDRPDGTRESSWSGCDRGTAVQHIATTGGHGWPGSSSGFNPAPAEPDASREIGAFLLAHPRATIAI
ncbi:MAG: PHB depolymerase family esterase [Candidatus Thermoplasmatota archaeon]|jgi:polyhydroxybutyrate depolymerase